MSESPEAVMRRLWAAVPPGDRARLQAAGVRVFISRERPLRGIISRYLRTERTIVVYRQRLAEGIEEATLLQALRGEIGQALNPSGDGAARAPAQGDVVEQAYEPWPGMADG